MVRVVQACQQGRSDVDDSKLGARSIIVMGLMTTVLVSIMNRLLSAAPTLCIQQPKRGEVNKLVETQACGPGEPGVE